MLGKILAGIELTRPFTLIAPLVGFIAAALIAAAVMDVSIAAGTIALGVIAVVMLNAASNATNQIFDVEIDRMNKPERPLPSTRLERGEAAFIAMLLYAISIVAAVFVNAQFFVIVIITAIASFFYSAPPLRLKRFTFVSNATIALFRGLLLIVAGWAAVASVYAIVPWVIGSVLALFLFGAASTKDFVDVKGDREYGINSLPVRFGAAKAVKIMAPFFVLPFLLIPLLIWLGFIAAAALPLTLLSIWGIYIIWLMQKQPQQLTLEKNHISWFHMYALLVVSQLGFAAAYVI